MANGKNNRRNEADRRSASVLPRFMNESDMSGHLGVSPRLLQGWRMKKKGPPYRKFEGRVLYDMNKFEEWAERQPSGGGR